MGPTGLTRLFGSEMGSQISWLLPAALVLLAVVLVATWRQPRTSRTRASMVLWGGWLLVTGLVFSLAQGIIHPYYTVALAPAIGAIVGIGSWFLWCRRGALWARLAMGSVVVGTLDLGRRPARPCAGVAPVAAHRHPGCRAASRVLFSLFLRTMKRFLPARAARSAVVGGGRHWPSWPDRGPTPWLPSPPRTRVPSHRRARRRPLWLASLVVGRRAGAPPGEERDWRRAGAAGFAPGGGGGQFFAGGPGGNQSSFSAVGRSWWSSILAATSRRGQGGGGIGGLLNSSTPGTAITDALKSGASRYRWVAAVVGSNEASGYQLAAGEPVMAIGGFNGTDPAPTLAEFENYVKEKQIHYFIASGSGFGGPSGAGTDDASLITSWVESHFTATTIDGVTVYDLSAGAK